MQHKSAAKGPFEVPGGGFVSHSQHLINTLGLRGTPGSFEHDGNVYVILKHLMT